LETGRHTESTKIHKNVAERKMVKKSKREREKERKSSKIGNREKMVVDKIWFLDLCAGGSLAGSWWWLMVPENLPVEKNEGT